MSNLHTSDFVSLRPNTIIGHPAYCHNSIQYSNIYINQSNMAPMDETLDVAELLEAILLQLPMRHVLLAQRVSRG